MEMHVNGDVKANPVLLHVLKDQFDVTVDPADLIPGTEGNDASNGRATPRQHEETVHPLNVSLALDVLNRKASSIAGFHAGPFSVIGNFSFQKLAMVNDIEKRRSELVQNDVVAAIAGDVNARKTLGSSQLDTDPKTLDAISPNAEFQVVEADSSQQCAILGVVAGQSAVIHGPPGTGKSQTITNLIATLTATGKKVLFVAEKRDALEVVMGRLKQVGLDHLAVDLHGAEQTPKKVMEHVAKTLTMVREAPAPASSALHQQFVDRRTKLNDHDRLMHTAHPPTGMTVFEMQGALLRLPTSANSQVRWRASDLLLINQEISGKRIDHFKEAAGFAKLFTRSDSSPWNGVQIPNGETASRAIDLAAAMHRTRLPELQTQIEKLTSSAGVRTPETLNETDDLLLLLEQARRLLAAYEAPIFADSSLQFLKTLSMAKTAAKSLWHRIANKEYRHAFNAAIRLRKNIKVNGLTLVDELTQVKDIAKRWQAWRTSDALPCDAAQLTQCRSAYGALSSGLQSLFLICGKMGWREDKIEALAHNLSALSQDSNTPYRLLRLWEIEQQLSSWGAQPLVDEIRFRHISPELWGSLFQYAWLQSALDDAAIKDPHIRGFVGATHDGIVAEFQRLDSDRLNIAASRIRRAHAERTISAMNAHPEQEHLIRAEAAKKPNAKRKTVRQIFSQATEVLTAVCPCWMASPLSVSQLIDATGVFDYVIFDEASQVLPEDAIPAILRGRHVVVAGDRFQLPPTTFFSAGDDGDEDEGDSEGYESLLDMMVPFVKSSYLNWHYRSRDESLIAFSNHFIYDGRLVTFPGPGGPPAIAHVLVDGVPIDGQEESASPEVNRVVDLTIQHAITNPGQTLGVITMGTKHALRIQAALDRTLLNHPELAEFFDTGRSERFFVKNLERVQGDERDAIIISIGYGKDRAGNLPLHFGPILSAGGRRRLNVAVTRARQKSPWFLHSPSMTSTAPGYDRELASHSYETTSNMRRRTAPS